MQYKMKLEIPTEEKQVLLNAISPEINQQKFKRSTIVLSGNEKGIIINIISQDLVALKNATSAILELVSLTLKVIDLTDTGGRKK